ncbi:hypothetical protein Isop_2551 [Isosphaera pallida ATCC 43644]|uniref:Lipoprotein n=1 Tax=Isosphaera pallida (strain ATCC 43644 / DSM 9630 / IS1B) TaxID=575540 RepID=E8QYC7_ISOPI|nr:hypothetical protein Isop_2551 [Isosphaera pallida ATCC 43644]
MRSQRPIQPTERKRTTRGIGGALSALALVGLVGCQAEYAGMTLPSGKYLFDDVQYFEPGPHFRWANTQAATQRARMEAMGINPNEPGEVPPPPPPAAGGQATPPPPEAMPDGDGGMDFGP